MLKFDIKDPTFIIQEEYILKYELDKLNCK